MVTLYMTTRCVVERPEFAPNVTAVSPHAYPAANFCRIVRPIRQFIMMMFSVSFEIITGIDLYLIFCSQSECDTGSKNGEKSLEEHSVLVLLLDQLEFQREVFDSWQEAVVLSRTYLPNLRPEMFRGCELPRARDRQIIFLGGSRNCSHRSPRATRRNHSNNQNQ
ncbi:hypothetical protein BJ138DRAFT_1150275 [Hygrophoropsis aurantiaca]|uniref:Uncharacterized protein n=1 Tax=Hygrophoropsis aurantiaca TaxID=72124 RepID=A0ACB8AEG1_9AGAM|nr:hypothetical protein BJ138DRAFT_1150275 [Hygrophoropsis aurantiaca]